MDNLVEVGKFLKTYNLSKVKSRRNQKLHRPVSNEIELVIQKILQKQKFGHRWIHSWIYKTFKERLILNSPQLFQNIEKEGKLPNKFSEASIYLNTKTKDTTERENYTGQKICDEHRCKKPRNYYQTSFKITFKGRMPRWLSGWVPPVFGPGHDPGVPG